MSVREGFGCGLSVLKRNSKTFLLVKEDRLVFIFSFVSPPPPPVSQIVLTIDRQISYLPSNGGSEKYHRIVLV